MSKELTDKQIKMLTDAILLFNKKVSFVEHHDEGPSVYINGTIIGVKTREYSSRSIDLIVNDPDYREDSSIEVCEVLLKNLIENGKYESDYQWSRSSTFINIK